MRSRDAASAQGGRKLSTSWTPCAPREHREQGGQARRGCLEESRRSCAPRELGSKALKPRELGYMAVKLRELGNMARRGRSGTRRSTRRLLSSTPVNETSSPSPVPAAPRLPGSAFAGKRSDAHAHSQSGDAPPDGDGAPSGGVSSDREGEEEGQEHPMVSPSPRRPIAIR